MLIFLGERYGWCPGEKQIEEEASSHKLVLDDYGISVTEFEIQYGALRDGDRLSKSKFYFCLPDTGLTRERPGSKVNNLQRLKQRILQITHGLTEKVTIICL